MRVLCDGRERVAQGDDELGYVGHDDVEARAECRLLARAPQHADTLHARRARRLAKGLVGLRVRARVRVRVRRVSDRVRVRVSVWVRG